MCAETTARRGIPDTTVSRLPGYLRALAVLADEGLTSVSSRQLADAARVRPTQVRKDLSLLGALGVRGVGYDVARLSREISATLGVTTARPVVIVGLGNLGRALAAYAGFGRNGFAVRALVDADPSLAGTVVAGVPVRPLDALADIVRAEGIVIGIIATPAEAAEDVCDRLVAGGVRSVLNFAPTALRRRPGVRIRRVDLASELHILAFQDRNREYLVDLEVGT